MTWTELGWAIIGLGSILLIVFSLAFKKEGRYRPRKQELVNTFLNQRVRAVEQGKKRLILLGEDFWSQAFPGLGLHALTVLPGLIKFEDIVEGGQVVSAGRGELVLFARQVIQGRYQEGFSPALHHAMVSLVGFQGFSFTAGLLSELNRDSPGSLAILGGYGFDSVLWAESVQAKGGHVFAAAGTISAQAALYLTVRDLLIGEEVFMLPGLIKPMVGNQAGWTTEDILRLVLIALLILVSLLKAGGIL